MLNKPLEYWAVLIGMVLYAASRDAEKEPLIKRVVKVAASAFLAVGLSPSLAPYLRGSETAAAVAIMAFGLLILDVGTAIIGDRKFIQDLIKSRVGGGGGAARAAHALSGNAPRCAARVSVSRAASRSTQATLSPARA